MEPYITGPGTAIRKGKVGVQWALGPGEPGHFFMGLAAREDLSSLVKVWSVIRPHRPMRAQRKANQAENREERKEKEKKKPLPGELGTANGQEQSPGSTVCRPIYPTLPRSS